MSDDRSSGTAEQSAEATRLAQVMAATSKSLQADFEGVRAAFTHSTIKGSEGEDLVAKFLNSRLPEQIGVTAGQVIDSTGAISKQLDVVLYDKARTPMLFSSNSGKDKLIPAEGVLAVVEVKTHLKKAMLPEVIANCQSIKQLQRTAYFRRPIKASFQIYGREWTDFPVYYSLFAARSDGLYAGALNELQSEVEPHLRIDSVCYLDRGANLNVSMPSPLSAAMYSATPSPDSALCDIDDNRGLLYWYSALASIVAQAEVDPINILDYMASELKFHSHVPPGKFVDGLIARTQAEVAAHANVPTDVVRRFMQHKMTNHDAYELLRSEAFKSDNPKDEDDLRGAREAARRLPFEEWEKHFDISQSDEDRE